MQPQGECRINIVTGQNMQPANRQIQAFAGSYADQNRETEIITATAWTTKRCAALLGTPASPRLGRQNSDAALAKFDSLIAAPASGILSACSRMTGGAHRNCLQLNRALGIPLQYIGSPRNTGFANGRIAAIHDPILDLARSCDSINLIVNRHLYSLFASGSVWLAGFPTITLFDDPRYHHFVKFLLCLNIYQLNDCERPDDIFSRLRAS
ncbi:hypothetical protein MKX08_009680 [Trichoderma sp. CBMAI-0020]|nr:hypothetical protein MKX08_009680 [Trichoderma sp. CBMAI-0020]